MERNWLSWVTLILVVIGALNWALVGISSFSAVSYGWDVVALILGSVPWLAAIIYILIGIAGIYELVMAIKNR